MLIALTRAVPPTIANCELTHVARAPIDLGRAVAQHAEYEAALGALGARVERVDAAPDLPDSVFIEDTAVIFDEVAVLMRPGASSRRLEVDAVAATLERYRPTESIVSPGTMDGGDVLQAGRRVFVGLSLRTNRDAARQLQAILEPATDDLLVLNPAWIDPAHFRGMQWVAIDRGEPSGANVVRVGTAVVCAASAPRTRERLESRGLTVRAVDASELAKAEGALTCGSLIFNDGASAR
jgi:dimethylargininase